MRIAVNSLRNIAFRSATVGFLLLTGMLTARLLGPEGRGAYAAVTMVSGISVAFFGGMGTAVGYYISNLRRPVPEVVANVAVMALIAGTALLALSLVLYWLLGGGAQGRAWWIVVIGAVQVGLLLGQVLTWAFLGADDHTSYSYAILAPSFFTLVLMAVFLLAFPHSTRAALLAWLLAQYAVVGWLWWLGRAAWSPLPLERVRLQSMGGLVSFSFASGMSNIISYANLKVDALLVVAVLGVVQLGLYSVAVQMAEGLYFISQAVGVAIWAQVGGATREGAAALVARSIRFSLALMLVAGLALFGVAGVLVPLLFGGRFAEAATPLRLFIPGVVAWGMANLLAAFYTNQLGRPRVPLTIAAISLVVTMASGVVLVPWLGLAGGALATTAGYTTAIVIALILFHGHTGIPWRELLLVDRADLHEAADTTRRMLTAAHTILRRDTPPTPEPSRSEPGADSPAEPLFRRLR